MKHTSPHIYPWTVRIELHRNKSRSDDKRTPAMTTRTTYFTECDRLGEALSQRPNAHHEQAATPNVRAAAAVTAACFAVFGLAAVML